MPADQLLAIDQGSRATRAIVFDDRGHMLASAHRSVALNVRSPTEIEQSPDEIIESMQAVIAEVLTDPAISTRHIRAAGLATQRSSVVAWDRTTGRALSPVLSWQDRRANTTIESLLDQQQLIETRTGLRLSPHYGASKLQWLLKETNTQLMGPLASYLLYHLLRDNPILVDHANASRTLLWNLGTRNWDARMLALFDIPHTTLPACRPIVDDYGLIAGHNIPLMAVNGDQTAALHAQGRPRDDTLVINIGTGAFVLMPTPDPSARPVGLLAGISHSDADSARYTIEGTVNGAAAAIEQVAEQFDVSNLHHELPGWLEAIKEPTLYINTIGGLGSPWWQSGPQAYFLKEDVSAAEAMVATIESIVFLLQANIELMCQHNTRIREIRISGGLAKLDGLCQRLADLSGLTVNRPVQTEATARGIAWQAAGITEDWAPAGEGTIFTSDRAVKLKLRYEQFIRILKTDYQLT